MQRVLAFIFVLLLAGCQSYHPVYPPLPVPPPPLPSTPKKMAEAMAVYSPQAPRKLARPMLVVQAVEPMVSVAWDQSTDPTVNGYNVYEGIASQTYTNVVGVAPATNTTTTLGPLVPGTTYYFAATCTDTNGLESVYSNEVTYSVPNNTNTYILVTLQAAPTVTSAFTNFATVVITNPPAPVLFFKLSISQTNGF